MAVSQEAREFREGESLRLAVDVAIFNNQGEVLLGKRLAEEGFGSWGFPGGRMHSGEKIRDCAKRELTEELGDSIKVEITDEILAVRENNIPPNFVHHVTVILKGLWGGGEPQVMEPEKCSEWRFFHMDELGDYPLFSGVEETLHNHIVGKPLIVTDWHNKPSND